MARARDERPAPPRLPPHLTLERNLRLTAGSEISGMAVGGDYADAHLEAMVVEDSHITRSSFVAADLSRVRLVDVLVEGSDFSGADMEEATLTRVAFRDCRMSGARIHARRCKMSPSRM